MSDTSEGPDRRLASDGRCYPPLPGRHRAPGPRSHGRAWAVVAAVGLALVGVVSLVVAVAVVRHAVHRGGAVSGSPAGPPPVASYTVGQTGRSAGFAFTVYGVRAPLPSAPEYALPTPGYEYVQVDVQVTNTASAERRFSSLLAFHVYDSHDHQYGEAIVAGIQPVPPDGPFSPGQAVRGLVMFEVPTAATGLRLRCQGSVTAVGAVFTLP
jgi:hypothetical protein